MEDPIVIDSDSDDDVIIVDSNVGRGNSLTTIPVTVFDPIQTEKHSEVRELLSNVVKIPTATNFAPILLERSIDSSPVKELLEEPIDLPNPQSNTSPPKLNNSGIGVINVRSTKSLLASNDQSILSHELQLSQNCHMVIQSPEDTLTSIIPITRRGKKPTNYKNWANVTTILTPTTSIEKPQESRSLSNQSLEQWTALGRPKSRMNSSSAGRETPWTKDKIIQKENSAESFCLNSDLKNSTKENLGSSVPVKTNEYTDKNVIPRNDQVELLSKNVTKSSQVKTILLGTKSNYFSHSVGKSAIMGSSTDAENTQTNNAESVNYVLNTSEKRKQNKGKRLDKFKNLKNLLPDSSDSNWELEEILLRTINFIWDLKRIDIELDVEEETIVQDHVKLSRQYQNLLCELYGMCDKETDQLVHKKLKCDKRKATLNSRISKDKENVPEPAILKNDSIKAEKSIIGGEGQMKLINTEECAEEFNRILAQVNETVKNCLEPILLEKNTQQLGSNLKLDDFLSKSLLEIEQCPEVEEITDLKKEVNNLRKVMSQHEVSPFDKANRLITLNDTEIKKEPDLQPLIDNSSNDDQNVHLVHSENNCGSEKNSDLDNNVIGPEKETWVLNMNEEEESLTVDTKSLPKQSEESTPLCVISSFGSLEGYSVDPSLFNFEDDDNDPINDDIELIKKSTEDPVNVGKGVEDIKASEENAVPVEVDLGREEEGPTAEKEGENANKVEEPTRINVNDVVEVEKNDSGTCEKTIIEELPLDMSNKTRERDTAVVNITQSYDVPGEFSDSPLNLKKYSSHNDVIDFSLKAHHVSSNFEIDLTKKSSGIEVDNNVFTPAEIKNSSCTSGDSTNYILNTNNSICHGTLDLSNKNKEPLMCEQNAIDVSSAKYEGTTVTEIESEVKDVESNREDTKENNNKESRLLVSEKIFDNSCSPAKIESGKEEYKITDQTFSNIPDSDCKTEENPEKIESGKEENKITVQTFSNIPNSDCKTEENPAKIESGKEENKITDQTFSNIPNSDCKTEENISNEQTRQKSEENEEVKINSNIILNKKNSPLTSGENESVSKDETAIINNISPRRSPRKKCGVSTFQITSEKKSTKTDNLKLQNGNTDKEKSRECKKQSDESEKISELSSPILKSKEKKVANKFLHHQESSVLKKTSDALKKIYEEITASIDENTNYSGETHESDQFETEEKNKEVMKLKVKEKNKCDNMTATSLTKETKSKKGGKSNMDSVDESTNHSKPESLTTEQPQKNISLKKKGDKGKQFKIDSDSDTGCSTDGISNSAPGLKKRTDKKTVTERIDENQSNENKGPPKSIKSAESDKDRIEKTPKKIVTPNKTAISQEKIRGQKRVSVQEENHSDPVNLLSDKKRKSLDERRISIEPVVKRIIPDNCDKTIKFTGNDKIIEKIVPLEKVPPAAKRKLLQSGLLKKKVKVNKEVTLMYDLERKKLQEGLKSLKFKRKSTDEKDNDSKEDNVGTKKGIVNTGKNKVEESKSGIKQSNNTEKVALEEVKGSPVRIKKGNNFVKGGKEEEIGRQNRMKQNNSAKVSKEEDNGNQSAIKENNTAKVTKGEDNVSEVGRGKERNCQEAVDSDKSKEEKGNEMNKSENHGGGAEQEKSEGSQVKKSVDDGSWRGKPRWSKPRWSDQSTGKYRKNDNKSEGNHHGRRPQQSYGNPLRGDRPYGDPRRQGSSRRSFDIWSDEGGRSNDKRHDGPRYNNGGGNNSGGERVHWLGDSSRDNTFGWNQEDRWRRNESESRTRYEIWASGQSRKPPPLLPNVWENSKHPYQYS